MIQIKRILCPIDYSACSRRAFEQATTLARWYGASITVLHVADHVVNNDGMSIPSSVLLERPTRQQLENEVRKFVAAWPDVAAAVETMVAEGDVAECIVAAARARQADLVVMGIHGRRSVRYMALGVLGSVTNDVIRSSPCPVMVVPLAVHASSQVSYRHILCPVDFGEASLRAVEYAMSLAQESGATLVLFHVIDTTTPGTARAAYDTRPRPLNDEEAQEALSRLVPAGARQFCRPIELLASGKPAAEILRLAMSLEADLIVMGVAPRSAAEIMLLGSTADPVLRKATCPVLTLSAGPH